MTKKRYGPVVCQICRNDFYPFARSNYEANLRKTCSKECFQKLNRINSSKQRKKTYTYKCTNCGSETEDYPSRKRDIKFCSKKCHIEYQRRNSITKICKFCGNKFEVLYARRHKKYCNHQCYLNMLRMGGENHVCWKGGCAYYYGPNWQTQSEKARKRDNYTCQSCGKHQNDNYRDLDVHHIKRFQEFGLKNYKKANLLSNLITLCPSCHNKIESGKITI